MTSSDVLLVAWHGVEGDTRSWWAPSNPLPRNALPTIKPNQALDANAPAGPGVDPSGFLIASVGAPAPSATPSPITLYAVDSHGQVSGPGPLVPTTTDFLTTARPAVATGRGQTVLAWRHHDGKIRFSRQATKSWSQPTEVGGSDHGPAMAIADPNSPTSNLLIAFQGVDDRTGTRGQIRGSINGGTPFAMIPDAGGMFTSHAPALCHDTAYFWMAWKGSSDENIWLARSKNGLNWTEPHIATPVDGGINTIAGPGLATWEGGLILAWRGVTNDQALWWSTLSLDTRDGKNLVAQWATPQTLDPSDNSDTGPSLGIRHTPG